MSGKQRSMTTEEVQMLADAKAGYDAKRSRAGVPSQYSDDFSIAMAKAYLAGEISPSSATNALGVGHGSTIYALFARGCKLAHERGLWKMEAA